MPSAPLQVLPNYTVPSPAAPGQVLADGSQEAGGAPTQLLPNQPTLPFVASGQTEGFYSPDGDLQDCTIALSALAVGTVYSGDSGVTLMQVMAVARCDNAFTDARTVWGLDALVLNGANKGFMLPGATDIFAAPGTLVWSDAKRHALPLYVPLAPGFTGSVNPAPSTSPTNAGAVAAVGPATTPPPPPNPIY